MTKKELKHLHKLIILGRIERFAYVAQRFGAPTLDWIREDIEELKSLEVKE